MSRIQQLAEQAQMRKDIAALFETVALLSDQLRELEQAIANLQSIAKPLESPKRPGRPRKDDAGSREEA